MISIFIESKDLKTQEANFVKTYLEQTFPNFTDFEIIPLNGWQGLSKAKNKLVENKDLGNKNIVIFDADIANNQGGFTQRKQAIEKIKTKENLDFELFLFPNNSSDGDFELLLENIINPIHQKLLDCFEEYENCIGASQGDTNPQYVLPIRKAKIYSYIDAFKKSRKQNERFKKGDWFFDNKEYWNLDSEYLNSLKEFLTQILK